MKGKKAKGFEDEFVDPGQVRSSAVRPQRFAAARNGMVSTQHYLHFIEQLAASASERFERRCGALITAPGLAQSVP